MTCFMILAMAIPLQIVAPRSLVHGLLALTRASQWSYGLDLIAIIIIMIIIIIDIFVTLVYMVCLRIIHGFSFFFSLVMIRLFSVVEIPIKHSSLSNKSISHR